MFQNLLQRFRNISSVATLSDAIVLNNTTSTKIADANPNRMFFHVSIDGITGNNAIWIKLQAPGIDAHKKGIWIGKQAIIFKLDWEMPSDNVYIGEISAIADSGSPEVFVTEY